MKTATEWSTRSRHSFEEQHTLQQEIAHLDLSVRNVEKNISELEKMKARKLKMRNRPFFADTLRELEDENRVLAAYKKQRAEFQSASDKLGQVDARALKARQEQQARFAALISERLERDRKAEILLQNLQAVLAERAEVTAKMAECAAALDLTIDSDADTVDTRRFDELRSALPAELAVSSERWAGWFTGTSGLKPYIVRDARLVVRETLKSAGVYYFGETVELTDEEARELLREDRPAPLNDAPWRCAPPSIMTIEAHQEATAAAAEKGMDLDDYLLWGEVERIGRDKAAYRGEPHVTDAPDLNQALRVKVKAKRNIACGGRTYVAGDVFELDGTKGQALQLVQSGAVEAP